MENSNEYELLIKRIHKEISELRSSLTRIPIPPFNLKTKSPIVDLTETKQKRKSTDETEELYEDKAIDMIIDLVHEKASMIIDEKRERIGVVTFSEDELARLFSIPRIHLIKAWDAYLVVAKMDISKEVLQKDPYRFQMGVLTCEIINQMIANFINALEKKGEK